MVWAKAGQDLERRDVQEAGDHDVLVLAARHLQAVAGQQAAANKVTAPIPAPAKRRLQGGTSRRAMAAAIQLRPQAKARSRTSSLAVPATSLGGLGQLRMRHCAVGSRRVGEIVDWRRASPAFRSAAQTIGGRPAGEASLRCRIAAARGRRLRPGLRTSRLVAPPVAAVLASASIYRGFPRAPATSPKIGIPSWIPIVYAAHSATASGL